LHKAVRLAAIEDGVTMRDWIADALATYLRARTGTAADENGPQPAPATLPRRARPQG
jgi:hypothetical protein